MTLEEFKREMRIYQIPTWKLAKQLGLHENTIFRWLRTDDSFQQKRELLEKALKQVERG